MEDQRADLDDHAEAQSDKTANQGGRPGAQAQGGITAKPGDPSSPRKAETHAAALDDQMAKAGFGDHKGEDMGRDGTERRTE